MAAMTTVLTELTNLGNSRTSSTTGHTTIKPKIVIEKRRIPEGSQNMVEQSFKVVQATEDVDGAVLANKVSIEVTARYPLAGTYADVTASLAIAKDIIAGDEFANSVATSEWL